jgi:ABC-2 type transport system permease protein
MSAVPTLSRTSPSPAAADRGATSRSVVSLAVRQLNRGTIVLAMVMAGMPALVAVQYRTTLSGDVGLASLAALARNPAIRVLFGPPVGLDDVGGFTVWRTGAVLAVLVSVWALLAATRITRGEEEAGRWDLLLTGPLGVPDLVLRHLAVLAGACGVLGAAVTGGLLLGGAAPAGALVTGAALGGCGLAGVTVGVLTAQLAADRRTAAGLGLAVLAGGLALRMLADGLPSWSWVQWLTPYGLLARSAPFVRDDLVPLLVLLLGGCVTGALAWLLSGRRDVRAGLLRARHVRTARSGSVLLRSVPGFVIRRAARPAVGWAVALAAYFALIGSLATSLTSFLAANPAFADMAAQAGFGGLDLVEGYVATLFSLLAVPLGAFAASRMAALRADETAGRLAMLFSLPLRRRRWLAAEAVAVGVACLALAVVAALATWAGTRAVGADLSIAAALTGTLNVVPVALLCLGAALLALGWFPGHVLVTGVLPAAGGYLLLVFAQSFGWPSWVRGVSPFAHLAVAPQQPVDLAATVGLLLVAGVLGGLGLLGYARRDLGG